MSYAKPVPTKARSRFTGSLHLIGKLLRKAPFDFDAVKKSLSKTHRLLVCHEEHKTSGYAGEIAAWVNENCFEMLDAPILRVCSKDVHVAYCPDLEEEILPQTSDVLVALKRLVNY